MTTLPVTKDRRDNLTARSPRLGSTSLVEAVFVTSPAEHVNVPVTQFGVPYGQSFFIDFKLQFSKESSLVQV